MKCSITIKDARTLARIVNLAERCNCTYQCITAEHHGDASYYHVMMTFEGTDEAMRLLDSQLTRVLGYEEELSA